MRIKKIAEKKSDISEEQKRLYELRMCRCYRCCWGKHCGGTLFTCIREYCVKVYGEQRANG